ncbi:MAG: hypothetical protein K2L53_01645, partial [Clostridia bacterium]|nr:hypothetical protein [Clostridia bacterium]
TKEKPYTGNDIKFNLVQYSDKVSVKITSPNGNPAAHTDGVITVKYVGTYTVTISLADNGVSTCWYTTSATEDIASYTIVIKVEPKKLNPDIACSDAGFSWNVGAQPTMTITDERISGDNIDYYIYYLKSGDSTKYDDIDSAKQIVGDSVKVTMPNDLGLGSYTFVVELRSNSTSSDNGNYYIDGGSKTAAFSIVGNGITVTADDIKWKVNNNPIGQLVNGKLPLTYNEKSFTFSVDESNLKALGVKIDVNKGTSRGLEGDITQTNVGALYKVTVWLCNYDSTYDTYSGSFTLNYEIKQGKYDLRGVKWNYVDGTLTYDKNVTHKVELTGLPSSLSVSADKYDNNEFKSAGNYIASVLQFNNANSNYVTPLFNNSNTYDGTFDWTLNWSIGKATLNLEWESVDSGKGFKISQVKNAYREYIDKYIYTTADGGEISLDDIVVGDGLVRYWVEAVLTANSAKNYQISDSTKKTSFRVGNSGEKVEVAIDADSFTYDGNSHGGELKVVSGTLELGSIIKKYYKVVGGEKIALADGEMPVNAGKYVVELSLSESDENSYYLDAEEIEFSIAKAQIKAEWNTSGSSPVIANLDDRLKNVVGYVYYDSEGNELPDGATLEKGKTYKVKAILVGDNGENYEFVDEQGNVIDDGETQQIEFAVKNSNGNGNSIGGVGSGDQIGSGTLDEILAKLKEMPLWQIIAGVIS